MTAFPPSQCLRLWLATIDYLVDSQSCVQCSSGQWQHPPGGKPLEEEPKQECLYPLCEGEDIIDH